MTNFDIRFEARKRQMYASQRREFWKFAARAAQIFSCVASTAAAMTILAGHPAAAAWISLAVAAVCFFSMGCDADGSWRMFNDLMGDYLELERSIPDGADVADQEAAAELRNAFYAITKRDGSDIPCLDAVCDNEACVSFGIKPRLRLSLFEKWIGCHFPLVHYAEKAAK